MLLASPNYTAGFANNSGMICGGFMFSGKTAIVTGAGSGIGRALAFLLAKEGCNLALTDIDQKALMQTENMLKENGAGVKVSVHIADVSDKKQVEKLAGEVLSVHGKIQMLFNIAGVAAGGNFEDLDADIFENAMRINYFSMVYMMKAFWSSLTANPKAYIVNMSSITGKAAFAKNSAYSASKFAVAGFTNSVACELEKSNIRFTVVYPGAVSTDIPSNAISFGGNGDPNNPFVIAKGISPQKAAAQILKAVRKEKREVAVGFHAKLLYIVQRILPIGYWKIIKHYVRY